MHKRYFSAALFAIALISASTHKAFAEAQEVRLSYQYGLGFYPVVVVLNHKLIEKHAKMLGLGDVTVTGRQINGAATTNDALLSGSIDLATGGVGGLLQLWDKTNGGVRGLLAVNDMCFLLNTNDPSIKTVKDYLHAENHKIALPAVKVGAHAIVLAMEAEKIFGPGKQGVFDPMTVSMRHPDAFIALKTGKTEIKSHFASLPYSYLELHLKDTKIHTVLRSYDVFGGPHNNTVLYAMRKWEEANPKLVQAVFDAFVEAENWINAKPDEAAQLFKTASKSTLDVADIKAIITDKSLTGYEPAPLATMKVAAFLHKVGRIKKMPESWKDYFWPIAYKLKGS